MKIFAYEHSGMTGDGSTVPSSALGLRSDIMLEALLADISQIPGIEVTTVRSTSAPSIRTPSSANVVYADPTESDDIVEHCMEQSDAVWPLAPESGGILAALSERVLAKNKILIGCQPSAVVLTGSKYATSLALRNAQVPVVETLRPWNACAEGAGAWVVKPDDGAGCTNTHLFPDRQTAMAWIAEHGDDQTVLQPFVRGRHCSLSLICVGNDIMLLGLNEQRMVVSDNQLHFMGSTVNNIVDSTYQFAALAKNVTAAIPGLWGYVGIDFILGAEGPVVLEVNPRMTTSHAGLRESTGCNPTEMVIGLAQGGQYRNPVPGRIRPISVDLNTFPERAGAPSAERPPY